MTKRIRIPRNLGVIMLLIAATQSFAQSAIDEYRNGPLFLNHKAEAEGLHKELVVGTEGVYSKQFTMDVEGDSTHRQNALTITEILQDNQFRHNATRIDTLITIGTFPSKYTTELVFRNIRYVGNHKFLRYRLRVAYTWSSEMKTINRSVSMSTKVISSRKRWDRKVWDDISYEEMLKLLGE